MTLDELRARHPDLGFALYAYLPGEPVTLEVLAEEGNFTFVANTASEAIAKAFPDEANTTREETDQDGEDVFQ